MSDEEIQDIVITANLTPRKCWGFTTPFQAILKELGKDRANPVLIALLHLVLESRGLAPSLKLTTPIVGVRGFCTFVVRVEFS
jgi:hypothetical protein